MGHEITNNVNQALLYAMSRPHLQPGGVHPPPWPVPALQHYDVVAPTLQLARGGAARQPRADHDHGLGRLRVASGDRQRAGGQQVGSEVDEAVQGEIVPGVWNQILVPGHVFGRALVQGHAGGARRDETWLSIFVSPPVHLGSCVFRGEVLRHV